MLATSRQVQAEARTGRLHEWLSQVHAEHSRPVGRCEGWQQSIVDLHLRGTRGSYRHGVHHRRCHCIIQAHMDCMVQKLLLPWSLRNSATSIAGQATAWQGSRHTAAPLEFCSGSTAQQRLAGWLATPAHRWSVRCYSAGSLWGLSGHWRGFPSPLVHHCCSRLVRSRQILRRRSLDMYHLPTHRNHLARRDGTETRR